MSSTPELNLIDVFSPFCFLEYKNEMQNLKSGDQIKILIQDSEVVENLKKIISRSSDSLLEVKEEKDYYTILVCKN